MNNSQKTPIQKIKKTLNSNSLFVKRDDLLPISFGGNKVRKAVLFFNDLIDGEFDTVVTYGSSSSNHCRVIANLAAAKGIHCHIISPEEDNQTTSNSEMIKLFGAKLTLCPVSEVSNTIDRKLKDLKSQGFNPYFIQGGGHGNIGTQAYVNAYEEILNFERLNNIYFDYIFHTSGTGTTQAGLICGKLLNNDTRKIIGISNARKNPRGRNVILDSVNNYLNTKGKASSKDVVFIDDYILGGYGSYNDEMIEVIKDVLINEGIPMDTTYTGKAYWGMKEYIKKNQIKNKKILFIHTGGTPLFFDGLEELNNE